MGERGEGNFLENLKKEPKGETVKLTPEQMRALQEECAQELSDCGQQLGETSVGREATIRQNNLNSNQNDIRVRGNMNGGNVKGNGNIIVGD